MVFHDIFLCQLLRPEGRGFHCQEFGEVVFADGQWWKMRTYVIIPMLVLACQVLSSYGRT